MKAEEIILREIVRVEIDILAKTQGCLPTAWDVLEQICYDYTIDIYEDDTDELFIYIKEALK